jgi:serine/threonine protein kinase
MQRSVTEEFQNVKGHPGVWGASSSAQGGIVLMQPGIDCETHAKGIKRVASTKEFVMECSKMYRDIKSDMNTLHEAGYVHCDLRRQNIMYFKHADRYQLIDYGHARKFVENEKFAQFTMTTRGSQLDYAPISIHKQLGSEDQGQEQQSDRMVNWYPKDDESMLFASFCWRAFK